MLSAIHHVQLAIPPGGEDAARAFYGGVLGMTERPKPPVLAARGGCWFRVGPESPDNAGAVEIHLGVEEPFVPARKAHPGLLVEDADALAARLAAGGHPVTWDDSIPGRRRFHSADAHGNRLEFIQR
jgi:catechol 2,3-dioxygenase-like lactoylglutathione lyase family enzyme